MTVSYSSEVATTTSVGIFWKLLVRWKGSIYKLIWREVLVFIALYYCVKLIYVYALGPSDQLFFEEIVLYCRSYSTSIPLSFVLGFYVNLVMDRWWKQYKSIPWPDTLGLLVSTLIHGQNKRSRMMRRTIMRYVNCSYIMALSVISPRVRDRYPSLAEIVDAGFMEPNEKEILERLGEKVPHSLYWMPLVWASSIVIRARKEGLVNDDFAVKTMIDTITEFRSGLASLLGYHSISIPLVYTQVVTLAVYSFFAGNLLSSQYIDTYKGPKDLIIPWFTLLQYLFYVGWLKVAETLVNPFGTDDDDFELNILIDRNFQVGYLIVDEMHEQHPELIQDRYWDKEFLPSDGQDDGHLSSDAKHNAHHSFFTKGASPLLRRMTSTFRKSERSDGPNVTSSNPRNVEDQIMEEGALSDDGSSGCKKKPQHAGTSCEDGTPESENLLPKIRVHESSKNTSIPFVDE